MLPNTVEKIGKTLRDRREMLGLLQSQLGSIAAISTKTIQLVEAGKANPSIKTILQLTDALGLVIHLKVKEPASGGK